MMLKRNILLLLLVTLSACQTIAPEQLVQRYQLQPVPVSYDQRFWLHQLQFNQQQELLVQVEFSGQQMNLVAMTTAGIPVAQLSWQSDLGLSYLDKPAIPLDWQQVIRDIQWIHWPLQQVKAGLPEKISVRQQASEHGKILRQFRARGELLAEIHYQGLTILMNNQAQGYQLRVTLLNEGS